MKLKNIFMAGLALVASIAFTACETEWPDTDPLNKQGVNLVAYGPNPVARGGQLRFVGTGLDQIKSVCIADGEEITEIEVINDKDIRITVPQNAKPGNVVLTTQKGEKIEGKRVLTYTEPVGFAEEKAFAPSPVKPGSELTINGEYLNLVQKVILTDAVEITEFKEHSREKIVIVVPEVAQSGKVTLSFCATGDTIPNEIVSKEKLEVVLPAVAEIVTLDEKKPGDEITITGTDFDLITKVLDTNGEELSFKKTATTVTFNLPEVVINGVIKVVPASGVEVPVATIGVALPKVSAASPLTDLRADDVITLTGTDFEIISSLTFTAANGKTVDAAIEEGRSATSVSVKFPAAAISGAFVINTTAGIIVEDAEKFTYVTLKPAFTVFDPAEQAMGGDVVARGQNMDLISSVTLTGGANLEVTNVTATEVTFTLPYADAETGTVTLHMANGESVETISQLTVNAPVCCYVTVWPELVDDEPIQAGTLLRLEVENREVLTAVEIDGENCQFILNGANVLFVNIPESAGKKSHVKLISSNGEIDYAYAFKPNSEITTILWKGTAVADDWGNQPYVLSDGGAEFIAAGVMAGDIITFYVTATDLEWKLEILEGHWGPSYAAFCSVGSDTEGGKFAELDLSATGGKISLVLTQAMVDAALVQQWWGGIFVLNGDNVIVSKITNTHKVAVEETLWRGEAVADDWGNQPYVLTDGGAEFINNEVTVGQTIYFYITPLDSEWKLEILEGHWGPSYAAFCSVGSDTEDGKFAEVDLSATGGKIGLEITQAMYDAALVQQWWGGIFVLNGDNVKVTKITVM